MIPDFDPPEGPPDVRAAVLAVRTLLRRIGFPPRGPDGEHRVILACLLPQGVEIELLTWTRALQEFAPDPVVLGELRRVHDEASAVPLGVVLLAIGEGGHFWCVSLGQLTHLEGASPQA